MKKLILASILATATGLASAADLTLVTGRTSATDSNFVGVTTSVPLAGPWGVQFGLDRSTTGSVNTNRGTALLTAEVAKVLDTTVSLKGGLSYINSSTGDGDFAGLTGIGIESRIDKKVSLVLDYAYQYAHGQIPSGSIGTLGVKVRF